MNCADILISSPCSIPQNQNLKDQKHCQYIESGPVKNIKNHNNKYQNCNNNNDDDTKTNNHYFGDIIIIIYCSLYSTIIWCTWHNYAVKFIHQPHEISTTLRQSESRQN